ncbi:DUF6531 domain-containing protein [Amycolatopsis sp. NPDC051903]|uniref:DUF6531 domain-containing protein n=1 Tax=Amycolatopsis sp. NPDC051903 TaxID=3363936 RepID=UPI0037B2AE5F
MSNPLIASTEDSTKAYSGISLLETANDLSTALESGDWASVAMGAVGTGLDALSMAMDPFGAILAAGVSWLMEHVGPLKDALNGLTGNADQIKAQAETWANVAKEIGSIASDMTDAVNSDLQTWTGAAADAYRRRAGDTASLLQSVQKGCEGASSGVKTAGEVVAAVRTLVRDIISELVGHLISWALQVAATLGVGLLWVGGEVASAVAKTASQITQITTKLIKAMKALVPLLKNTGTLFDDAGKALKGIKGGKVSSAGKGGDVGGMPKGPPKPAGSGGGTPKGGPAAPPPAKSGADDTPPAKSGGDDTTHSASAGGGHGGDTPPPPAKSGGDDSTHASGSGGGDTLPPPKSDPPPPPKTDPEPPPKTNPDPAPGGGGSTTPSSSGGGGTRSLDNAKSGDGGKSAVDESTPPPGRTAGGDPVDVVTGEMFMDQEDLELPGLLPVLFERTHVSGYRRGRWFGREWASTLDQRVEVDAQGLHYVAADGVVLHYPVPEDDDDLVEPSEGARWPLRWNRGTDTILIGRPEAKLTFSFPAPAVPGAARPLETVGDLSGNWMTISHDAQGVPTDLRHSGGYHVRIGRVGTEAGPRVADLRMVRTNGGPDVPVVSFGYDDRGRLTRVADSQGRPMVFEYDDQDRVVAWVDRVGQTYRYVFDEASRVVRTEGTGNVLTAAFQYDLDARVTTMTDSLGRRTRYHYNEFNQVTKVVDALGAETINEYTRFGTKVARTDEAGRTARLEPGDGPRTVREKSLGGAAREFEYDEAGRPIRVTGSDGQTWRLAYDGVGNLVSEAGPHGAARTYEYGERGDLVAVTDELGRVTRFQNDAAGLPMAMLDPAGGITRYERDVFGRLTSVADPLGGIVRTGWTVEGLVSWRVGADGSREEWDYDAERNVVAYRNPSGAETSFEYGPFGEVTARLDPAGARYTYAYDTELRLTKVTGPTGLTWQYEFDAADNLVLEKDFDGATRTYSYDELGRRVRKINGAGQWATYRYDEKDRIVEARTEHGVHTRSYDETGRLSTVRGPEYVLEFGYDADGAVVDETLNGRTTSYTYDELGRILSRTTPSGAESVWTYDAAGNPLTLAAAGGGLAFGHDAAGRETERRLGAGITLHQSYDPVGRLTRQCVRAASGGSSLLHRDVSYRSDGMPVQISDLTRGTRSYELDDAGRVRAVRGTGWTESYDYDLNGNLVRAESPTGHGPTTRRAAGNLVHEAGDTTFHHDAEGRVVRAAQRDASGVRQWTYTWDAENRLVAVATPDGSTWRYLYDAFGRRIAKRCLGRDGRVVTETWFTWEGTRLAEQQVATAGLTDVTTWDWQPGTHRVVAQSRRRAHRDQESVDIAFHAIVTDLVGTPTELVSNDGRVAWHTTDVWGVDHGRPVGEADFPLRFPGQYHDTETGLNYNLHRYYNPLTAGYLSPDPLGLNPAPNNHAYVDNPLAYLDPLGLMPTCMTGIKNALGNLNPFKKKQQAPAPVEPPPSPLGPSQLPDHVYRWDGRPPDKIQSTGMESKEDTHLNAGEGHKVERQDLPGHVLSPNQNNQWVSTSEWSGTNSRIGLNRPYLYKIDTSGSPNFHDVNGEMGYKHSHWQQKEWAHDGSIPAGKVVGYVDGKDAHPVVYPHMFGPNYDPNAKAGDIVERPPDSPSNVPWKPLSDYQPPQSAGAGSSSTPVPAATGSSS